MKAYWIKLARAAGVTLIAISWAVPGLAQEALPSWNDTAPRKAIVAFVERVTKRGSPDFVPPPSASPPSTTTAPCGLNSRSISSLPSHSTA